MITINFLLCGFFFIAPLQTHSAIVDAVAMQIQGMVYIPVLLSGLIRIRNTDGGIFCGFFFLWQ